MSKIRVLIIEDSEVARLCSRKSSAGTRGWKWRLRSPRRGGLAPAARGFSRRSSPWTSAFQGWTDSRPRRESCRRGRLPSSWCPASVEKADLKISINALKAGALAIVEKPVGMTRSNYQEMANQLCTQLAIMSEVKLVAAPPGGRCPLRAFDPRHLKGSGSFRVMGIAASTGGPMRSRSSWAAFRALFRFRFSSCNTSRLLFWKASPTGWAMSLLSGRPSPATGSCSLRDRCTWLPPTATSRSELAAFGSTRAHPFPTSDHRERPSSIRLRESLVSSDRGPADRHGRRRSQRTLGSSIRGGLHYRRGRVDRGRLRNAASRGPAWRRV